MLWNAHWSANNKLVMPISAPKRWVPSVAVVRKQRETKPLFRFLHPQAEEEARSLQKKIQNVENDLDQTQEALTQVNTKLDEKNKALQNVSTPFSLFPFVLKKRENPSQKPLECGSWGVTGVR